MEQEIKDAWWHIARHQYTQARAAVEPLRSPARRDQTLKRVRQLQRQYIQDLWRAERQAGAYNPFEELTLNLDEEPFEELDRLVADIQARIAARDPDLPHGWEWSARWRGQHPDGRQTSLHLERADALREMKRQMTPLEQAMARRAAQRQPVGEELFEGEPS
jgi:hypothetical protein